ncbi:MalY/PatB family protein [Curvivirga aplysinae]|uniref:MalY/PatB family protein n=1 Tax=Curvivirga aplysinae TaxID=2529852 RepID=UPI0012BC3098|nr:aminotransferase class I/II-fold pyridoxal phosphate-dependent enzyme [Curvivirga aplysinae]MTI09928.1 aminotransferase class I/II-fold pyridoxal phosphate-dependent enzyme [Curvivirga aplysinae]
MFFDGKHSETSNKFIKNSPSMLNNIFGTEDVTPMWVADMDFVIANPIKEELLRLANRAQFAYEFDSESVFNAISKWFKKRHALELKTENFTQVSGVLTGIALLIRELTQEGEGILIQSPAYHQFAKVIQTANRKLVKSPLEIVDGNYQMNIEDIENKLSAPDINLMILCNPHNPVGRVWKKDELIELTEIANKHNVTIISDEIHADIIYEGHTFTSLMQIDPEHHISLIGSPSKTFGLQSISNGYIYTENQNLHQRVKAASSSMYLDHGNAFTTFATIAAYEHGEEWLDQLIEYLSGNLSWIKNFLSTELPEVKASPVEGTYQIWLDFNDLNLEGDRLIEVFGTAGFGASPGTWFDSNATSFARVNFAIPLSEIQKTFIALKQTLADINTHASSTNGASKKQACC